MYVKLKHATAVHQTLPVATIIFVGSLFSPMSSRGLRLVSARAVPTQSVLLLSWRDAWSVHSNS
eukprot:4176080-Amphidinium_carterae.1